MSDEVKLRPCPFCGDVAPEPMERAMRCRSCWAVGPDNTGSRRTKEELWNWRRSINDDLYEMTQEAGDEQ